MTRNSDNYLRTQRQTEVGTSIDAKGGVAVQAGQDITRGGYINSDDGTVAWQPDGISTSRRAVKLPWTTLAEA